MIRKSFIWLAVLVTIAALAVPNIFAIDKNAAFGWFDQSC